MKVHHSEQLNKEFNEEKKMWLKWKQYEAGNYSIVIYCNSVYNLE